MADSEMSEAADDMCFLLGGMMAALCDEDEEG